MPYLKRAPEGEPGDLCGVQEAADILGVERTRIARYRNTGVMPVPFSTLAATDVWLRTDIERLRDRRANDA